MRSMRENSRSGDHETHLRMSCSARSSRRYSSERKMLTPPRSGHSKGTWLNTSTTSWCWGHMSLCIIRIHVSVKRRATVLETKISASESIKSRRKTDDWKIDAWHSLTVSHRWILGRSRMRNTEKQQLKTQWRCPDFRRVSSSSYRHENHGWPPSR